MQLVTTGEGLGRLDGDTVVLLDLPYPDLGALLADGATLADAGRAPARASKPLGEVTLRAPVRRPGKIWGIGLNYRDHAAETGREAPPEPTPFLKAPTAVLDPGEEIVLPFRAPHRVDFEGEVAVVMGRTAKAVSEESAWEHVAGVTAANDVSARDVQRSTRNNTLAKSFDTFGPMGASVASVDSFPDPDDIALVTKVNGENRQSASTRDLVYAVPYLVAWLSSYTTLEPGDVISTGTPSGVGMADGRFLTPGDTIEVMVQGVLPLRNTVRRPG